MLSLSDNVPWFPELNLAAQVQHFHLEFHKS